MSRHLVLASLLLALCAAPAQADDGDGADVSASMPQPSAVSIGVARIPALTSVPARLRLAKRRLPPGVSVVGHVWRRARSFELTLVAVRAQPTARAAALTPVPFL